MSEKTAHEPIDRTGWEAGPWDNEPDRAEWYDEATDYPCLAKRNHWGVWCGYVAVPPGHPFHKLPYGDVDVDVHGDLTYSDLCADDIGICHVPRPGEPDDVWWLGFDCGHGMDYSPSMDREMAALNGLEWLMVAGSSRTVTYRTLDYVKQQCAYLAGQLKAAA